MPRRSPSTCLLSLVLALCAALAAAAEARAQGALPSPEQFFGHPMGADRQLAGWDRLVEYYRLVDERSDRLHLVEMGPSTEGRPFLALFISSPENLGRLERLRTINARLSDPRGVPEAEIRELVEEGRAVVVQTFALHSSEVAASQTAAEFVYESVTRNDEENQRILDQVISIVIPSFNPDGTQMIADWYMKYVGTEYEAAQMPWLYQKYVGHDNNRDAFMTNMVESQYAAKILFRDWIPQAYVDHHQMGGGGARLYIPPYAEPVRPDADPLVWREMSWWGGHMGTKLEQAGITGVVGAAIYAGWGHMGFHWITPFHNIAGMLTESASARLATPVFMHFDQIRGGQRQLPAYEVQTTMPSLWQGGWWHVRDIVVQQKISAWATLDLAARHKDTVLWNAYLKARRQTERGADGDVKAYVVPAAQHDALTAHKMIRKLLDQGIEIRQAPAEFVADGRVYGPGSFVIPMAQPKRGVIRWLLGRTVYPDNSYTRDREGKPIRPYDMSTDTMHEFMGVRVDALGVEVSAPAARLTAHPPLDGRVAGNGPWVLDGRLNDSFAAANLALARGGSVSRVRRDAGGVRAGDFVVSGVPGAAAAEVASRTGVPMAAAPEEAPGAYPLRAPRIGLFQRYLGGNMDEGWTRFVLEQFAFPYTTIRDKDILAGTLGDRFDVIVLPADSVAMMTGDRPREGEGRRRGPDPESIPPEYRSGFGDEGVAALDAFVKAGGRLVTFAQSGDLPIERFGLPVRNVVDGLDSLAFWSPGSTLRVRFHADRPLAYGMPDRGLVTFLAGSQVYEITSTERSQDVEILATYEDRDLLESGWLLGEDVIAGKAAMVAVRHGEGQVVLIGIRPQHRSQTHGTFKLLFNALVTAPAPAPRETTTAARPR